MKTNTDHTNNSILFEALFDEPIESTVGSRGRRNWIKLPISDVMEMRRLMVFGFDFHQLVLSNSVWMFG